MLRSVPLDALRAVAVILVLFRHSTFQNTLQHVGWIGVDLFFVLSGYLVTSLVFREYLQKNSFDPKRFFIRRGFKIYPAFYFFLIVSLAVNWSLHDISYNAPIILSEVFFLQSYLAHIWTHTWSIAVEEHFYLMLMFTGAIWLRKKRRIDGQRLLFILVMLLLLIFFIRITTCLARADRESFAFFATHLRMDGILCGAAVSVIRYFHPLWQYCLKHRYRLLLFSLFLIWPPFVMKPDGFWMNTVGLTMMNIAFALLLLFVIAKQDSHEPHASKYKLLRPLAFVGVHSYSIYLWHLLVLQECQRFDVSDSEKNTIYLVISVIVGIAFSYAIERPALMLRDKLIPAVSRDSDQPSLSRSSSV